MVDKTIFDGFVVPDGVRKEVIIENILMESMDMELLFTNPAYLKNAISAWSLMWMPVWLHLWQTTQYEYNPIDNYDRTETRTWTEDRIKNEDAYGKSVDSGDSQGSGTHSNRNNVTRNGGKDSESNTTGETDDTTNQEDTTTTDKAAYNSDTYEPVDKVVTENNQTHNNTVTGKVVNNETSTETENGTDSGETTESKTHLDTITTNENRQENENVQHGETIKASGNIGVTTTQQMIMQEREIAQFNLEAVITNAFLERFFLLVY